jgi:hypothetical protein
MFITRPAIKEQISVEGFTYSRRHDMFYRAGMAIQVLGAALLAVLYPLESPFYTLGIMLFEAGVLFSAVYLLIGMPLIKKLILLIILGGFVLQAAGFYISEEYAGSVIIGGIGLVCAGAAGMAGNEAYQFRYREGWLLALFGFPIMVIANLLGRENRIFNSVGFSVLFLLLLSLAGKRLRHQKVPACMQRDGIEREKNKYQR